MTDVESSRRHVGLGGWAVALLPVIGLAALPLLAAPSAVEAQETARSEEGTRASSQAAGPRAHAPDRGVRRSFPATRMDGGEVEMDGRLDEEVWTDARFESDFIQLEPNEGEPATQRTEVAILYADEALYVGARMYRDDPEAIQAWVTRRDDAGSSARLVLSLDTFRDRRTAYSLAVNPAGVRIDYYHPEDRDDHRSRDYSWDPVWEAATHVHDEGWTAEMRIPFSQLRFNERDEQIWGIQVNRWIPSINEDAFWAHIPRTEEGWASQFGDLVGLEGVSSHRPIEVLPYLASSGALTEESVADDPFRSNPDVQGRLGANLKAGVGSNLTLDATVNPDFGQVEADPAVVNLSAFETFFDERRPFFTEGSQLLEGQGPSYFYSRRIGRSPQGSTDGDYVDRPDNTTILGAGKLTGRLPSGFSVGALAAVTDRETARTFDTATGQRDQVAIEPLTGYGVLRLQQEFGASASTAGLSMTGVRRDLSEGQGLGQLLAREAYSGGADWNLRFDDGAYELTGHAGLSHVSGDPDAILGLQRSSARYFQRPDADHVSLDSARTSLTGYTGSLGLRKRSGEHWLWDVGADVTSPGFEINDLGRLREADQIETEGEITYRETDPGPVFRSWDVQASLESGWNFDGDRTSTRGSLRTSVQWHNYMRSSLRISGRTEGMSDTRTRGGPLMATPAGWSVNLGTFSSFTSPTSFRINAEYGRDGLDGWRYSLSGGFSFRPTQGSEVSFNPRYSREEGARQYLTTLDDGREATFGRRYVFSRIERSTLSAEIRLDYAFTPDVSLELFAQPFVSSGRYHAPGELAAPATSRLRTYGTDGTTIEGPDDGAWTVTDGDRSFTIDKPDFNVLSFRSTAVLRWQWSPGSTFFLVWQQDRSGDDDRGQLVGPGELADVFGSTGEHVLSAKISYWLPL